MWSSLQLTPEELSALGLSLKVGLWCTALVAGPGILLGWLLARVQFTGKAIVDGLIHLPLVLPPVVPGYLLLLLLGKQGPLGHWLYDMWGITLVFTWQGAVVASAVMALPLMVRAVRLAVSLVEPRLEDAARTLGAGPLRVWLTITLPLAAPGILTGLVLAFARSLGEFGATVTFVGNVAGETRTLPLAIYTYTQIPGADGPALRLVIISILLALAALWLSELGSRRVERLLGK
ncbi:molybdate ABC transporter permease subunit [Candidatus Contendibacter odensensis]|uniref:Molybdenum transport system permease n=1 Tax=Candidatus Contendobacter odensis Run_B_J11 TaxID=1400861 RepID=A0A7U7GE38_9GAMM|nr:molybdate ABC transporter permease subunit [Candidatus Contendobacter odensis]CDH46139.1 molybdate transport protein (ABC superfamily, membrane) [Candidatus Contendobacter odensis Run_B_J11]